MITGLEIDGVPGNNTSTSAPVPVATTDRSIVKTVDTPNPVVGTNVVFTLIATNNGPSASTGTTVTDLLPAGYTYVASLPALGTTYAPATGLWTIGTLPAGLSSTLAITATVNATGPYANTATIAGNENDPAAGNNTATSTPVPVAVTDRAIVKTVDNLAPPVGSNVVFTLVAANNGLSAGTGITVTDLLPAGYTYVSSTPPAGTNYTPGTGLWTIGALANGANATMTITAKVNAAGPYANTATITGTETDPVTLNNTSTILPIPVPATDRTVVKTVNNPAPAVGSNVVFTLVATNNGPSPSTATVVTDLLPIGYTYVSSTPPAGTTYVPLTGSWAIGTLASGASATMTITATVNPVGPYINTAVITGLEIDAVPGNNFSTVTPVPLPVTDRAIVKTVNNLTPPVGSNVVFTLVAANNGLSDGTGITVTDLLPAGYTYVSSTPPAGTTYTPVTGLWSIGALASGANSTLTITATVNPTGPYANTATITGNESDPITLNNTSTILPIPVPTTDRSVVKTVNNAAPAVGSNVVFTLVATNNGPSTSNATVVTDLLPIGYTYVSSTPPAGTAYVPLTGSWTIGALASGASSTMTITATVNPVGPYANTAVITGLEIDGVPGNNTSTSTPVPVPTSDRSIVKTVSNPNPVVGTNVVFTLVATNNGPSAGTGITVTDLLPAGYTYVTSLPAIGTTYAPATGLWTIGTLPAGLSSTLAITATVNATGPYANTATITGNENDPAPGNNTSTNTPVPVAVTDRSIVKTVDNLTPPVGSNVVFTLVATNNGLSPGTGIIVTDLLPAGYTYVSSTPPAGTTYVPASGIWTIGALANGANATMTITAKVNATGPYANTATITGTETDPVTLNNAATILPVPVPNTDRTVVKTVNNPTPAVGSNVVFTLVATNNGPSPSTATVVTDLLPIGYTYVSSTPPAGTAYVPLTGSWAIGTLASGASATMTITATVNPVGPYANTAVITGLEIDAVPGNDISIVTPVPLPVTDRAIVKTVDNLTPVVGSNVVFTLVAANNGLSPGTGITVTDLLPAGYTYVSSTPPAGTTYIPATGLWTIGALAAGNNATLTITATVNPTGPYANTATITGTESDPITLNNTSTILPIPVPATDRSVVKTVDNQTPAVGSNIVFTLVATNNGPSTSNATVVTDLLPIGYTYVSSTPPAGTAYVPLTGAWTIGALASGANATMTITATVNPVGPYANTAVITGLEIDGVPGNNTSTSTPVPVPASDRSIVKTVSNPNPVVGTNVVFTLVATNNGPSAGTGITVTDLLPAGYTYVSSLPAIGTTYVPATGLWTIGTLPAGLSSTLAITATVNATGPYGNTATITGNENDPAAGNNTSTNTPVPVAVTDRSIVKTVDNLTPPVGSNVVFTLVATNNGLSPGTGIIVTDLLPAGYTYVSSTPPAGTTYVPASGIWTIGALANGANATMTITATVNATGPYANTATITGTETDPVTLNNTSTILPIPVPNADKSIVKTVNNPTPAVGSNVVFTLVATNNGPSPSTATVVTDLLPLGYTYVSSTPPAGTTYVPLTGSWAIGTLASGASATMTITATVNPFGPYGNTAVITGLEIDGIPGNNIATVTPTPIATTNLSIVKTVNNPSPYAGNQVIFTLAASNAGPSNATGVTVNDLVPSGYTFVSAAPSTGTYNSGTGVWTIGNLANGGNASLAITATVNPTGNYANTATITGGQSDPVTGNNTSTAITTPVSLQLTKTGPATVSAGGVVNYVVTVSNNGTGDALAQSIIDNVSATLTGVSWTATGIGTATVTTGATGLNNNVAVTGNIPAGGGNQIRINITGTVLSSSAAASVTNTAVVNTAGSPVINSNTVTTTITKDANVKIQKTGPATLTAGSNVSYTLNVTNTGPSDVNNVNIIDNVPAGLTGVTWSATPSNGAVINGAATGTGNVNLLAQIPAGTAAVQVVVNGLLSSTYTGTSLVNTATATPEPGVNNPVPATSTVTSTVSRLANVRITKSGPANIAAGQAISYTLHIINDGPSDAPGVVIQDVIPAQILTPTWTATTQNLATVSAPSGTGNINITGSIPSGTGVIDIVVNGTVNPATADGATFSNTATAVFPAGSPVTDPDGSSNASSVGTTVNNSADVRVSKNGPTTVNIGDPITYTIVVSNGGAGDITGAVIADNVPTSVTVSNWTVSAAGGATFLGPNTGTSPVINITGDIPVPGTITLVIQGTINSAALPSFTNTVTVTTPTSAPTSSVTTAVNQSTDLVIEKSGPQTATAGSPIAYTIKVSNAGPRDVNGLTINDLIPADIQNPTWAVTTAGTATVIPPLSGSGNIALTGNIAADPANYILVTVNGIVSASPSAATINNTATVTSSGAVVDFNLANNTSTASTSVGKQADFEILKTVDNSTPAVGNNVVFTLVANNKGPSDGTGIVVTDLLPSGYTYISSTPAAGTTYIPGTGVWTIDALATGTGKSMTITASVNAAGSYANTATITGTESDPVAGNNTATVTTAPTSTTNLALAKTVDNATPAVGNNVVFTLVATNNGPSDGTGLVVTDLLPAGYTYVSSTPPAGTTYAPATGLWTIGTLANTATSTLTITATVNATGSYANTATITGNENDPAPGNNTSTATTTPTATTNLALAKTVDNLTPAVGNNVVFTLVATNNGPSDGTGIVVTDLLPAGYTYASSTPPAGTTYAPATGLWTIGTLTNGATSTLTITASVNAAGSYANTASITGNENDPAPGNNTSTATPAPTATTNLALTKTVDNPIPAVGNNVVFTLVATNNGPSDGTGIVVTDLLPAGYTYVSSTPPAGTTYVPATGLWTIGTLTNGATSTLTITASVNAAGSYANTATITGTENDPVLGNNTSTATPAPTATTNLDLVKTVDNPTPAVGNNVVFTLVANNNGPSDGTGIVVTDLLPAGYTYVSSTPPAGTTYAPATGLWTIGTLTNGSNSTLTITATVNAAGPYANTASITGNENDPIPGNNTSTSTPAPTATTNLALAKTVDNPTPAVGNNVVFTLVATNNGPSDGTGIVVTDLLPAGYTYASSTPPAGTTYAPATGLWTIGTLTNGATSTLTITASVNATGSYANTASITGNENDPIPGNNTSTSTPAPTATTNLALAKTVDNPTPAVGNNVVFTLVATNNGPSNGTGIVVTDLLPAGYTYISATPPAGTTYVPASGLWTIGTLTNGATSTLTITASVNAAGSYANTATITDNENDPILGNNTSTATPAPTATTNLALVKTVDNPTPAVGNNVVFTLVATNNGPSDGTGIVVTDLLPAGYTYVSSTPPAGTTYAPATGLWTIGTLANGVTSTLTITASVNAAGSYANTATITGNENDPILGNNTSTSTPAPTATTNLALVKTVDNPTPAAGNNVVFTLVATNNGPSDGTGIVVTDLLPAGYTYVSSTPPAGTTYAPVTGLWTIGTLANGATSTLTITATVNAAGSYANTATITGNENDPILGNNTSTSTPAPTATTNLDLVKTVDNLTPAVGNNVVFTLVATNNGPSDGTGIIVTDLLPAGYTYVSSTPPAGTTYAPATGLWTIGTLTNGATSSLTITASVNAAGSYANTATITGNENDPAPGNNTSTVTPAPTATTNLDLVKTVDNPAPAVGNNVVFTLVATNNGPSDGTGIVVTDLLPAGYTYVSSTPPAGTTYVPATGLWTIGTLTNGTTSSLTITATVNAAGSYANTASITGTENDPAPGNNTSTVTPAPTATTNLDLVKTVDNPTPAVGNNVVFTLVATNNGPSDGTGIVVTDLLPAGYTYVSSTPPAGTTYVPASGLWTIGTLTNGAASTLTITATVNAAGPYANTATITGTENDPAPGNNTSTATSAPTATTNLDLVKTVNNATPAVGTDVTFTLVATNNGPSDGTGIVVTDLLPAGYTYVGSAPPAGTTYVPATGLWTIGTLTNAASSTLTITATVNAAGPYANTATITGNENDPAPGNNTSTVTPAPTGTTNLDLVKTVDNPTPAVGNNVVFTLVATNNGPSDGTGVVVTDLLPAGYTYVSSTPPAGTTYVPATGLWTIGTLTNGATSSLTITATVNATGSYANTASITGNENDPAPGNNTSTATPAPTATTNLDLVKTVDNPAPAVGNNVVFTLVATNNGPSNGTGIVVTDLLPAGYTYVSSTPPAGTTYVPATGLWTIGTLTNGATSTLTITATVNAAGSYANTATITGAENDPAPGNNTSTATPAPTATTNLDLVKTVNNANPAVGTDVTFTLVATNNGPSDGTGIVVTDLLPAGYTYVSSTPPAGTTYVPATGLWTIGTLTNAASSTMTITATVNAAGPYANTATITGNENDPAPGNNTSTATPAPTATTNLDLVKTVDNLTPAVGNNVVFTLVATNNGPSDGTGIVVTDLLPAGYTYVSSTPPAGTTYVPASGLWTIGTLTNGAASTLTITATVNATGPYANTATITGTENDPAPGNNISTVTPAPTATTNLDLVKTVDNLTPSIGSNVVFTLVATNNGPSSGTGIVVTDLLPAGYTYVSSTPPAGTTYVPATGMWTIGNLTNGATSSLTITATVNAAGPYANTATITGIENDPAPGNNTSTATPAPTATTNLDLVKTVDNLTPAVGNNVVFTLVATNNGPSNGTGIVVTDLLPAGYTYVSSTPPAGTTYVPATGLWTIGTLTNGATSSLTITATVNAAGPYANTATITGTENDPAPGNNTSTATPAPTATANLDLVKTVDNPTPAVGSNVVFTLVATNNGPSNGTGIVVTDLLPAGYTYVSSTPPAGTTYVPATGLWTIGTLTNAATSTLTITATVNATGPYANTAIITGSENDPAPGNNTSTATPAPTATTNLDLVKTVDNANPAIGSNVVFTLVATNNGPSNGTGIVVTDLLPAGYTYVSSTPPAGTTYVPATGLWTIGTLTNAATSTLTITATVNAAGSYVNTATITGTENDPATGNNTATATTTPGARAHLNIVKTLKNPAQANFVPGQAVVYTINVTNNGPSDAAAVTITDAAPAGTTISSWTAITSAGVTYPNTSGTGNLNETLTTLANGLTATYDVTVQTPTSFTGNLSNSVSATSTTTDPNPVPCTTCTTTPLPASELAHLNTVKTLKDPAQTSFVPGQAVVYRINVTNNGPGSAAAVTITDAAPAGTTISSWTAITSAGVTYPNTSGTGNLNETIATLGNGLTATYDVTVQTPTSFTGTLSNSVTTTSTTADPTPGPCTTCTTPGLPASGQAHLNTVKTLKDPAQTSFVPGQAVLYRINVTNNGPGDAAAVTITDIAPAGTTISNWTAITSAGVTYPNTSGTGNLNETLATLANGKTATYYVTVQTPVTFTGNLSNSVTATSTTTDPTPGPCTTCTTAPINSSPQATLVVVKTLKDPAQQNFVTGDAVIYTIKVTNNGPNDALDVNIKDVAPTGTRITKWAAIPVTGLTYPNIGGTTDLNETIAVLPNGLTAVYEVTVQTPVTFTGSLINTVVVNSRTNNSNSSNCPNCTTSPLNSILPDIIIPNVITPDGDGKNDRLVIPGIEHYPGSVLLIYNRWGNQVYRATNYDNSWTGEGLSGGTYYYVLQLKTGQNTKGYKGWIELLK
ncbi:putative repeat protein (TIGR01451 family)/gliding motility-associated-like protein [Pedobacter cryoconitis]|uniref:Putative repeat protein (TIGR01451 family)/gliding motility-associated-like protein n=1 Tax=Pedobacter cryoconitis TaxID=188932 RepID=A0A327SK66_9SPHI|nr:putative repeat protein (TIGR01451 family)/gliding motility-associated-like protein [Pedobacter cryoconitis]